jgi:ABC-type methionine transport system ATPase subunit
MRTIYQLSLELLSQDRITQARIKIKIPKQYYQDSIISHLISGYQLEVNILGALLGSNSQNDGWFDLELKGPSRQINEALLYLSDLDVEFWNESDISPDGW